MVERERDGGVEEEKGKISLISLTCSWNEKGNVSLVVYFFLFFFYLLRYARKRIIIELNVSF